MPTQQTVLLVGGTGRTGRRALGQLLQRGVQVRAIVRSAAKLPPALVSNPNLTVIEASLLSLSDAELQHHLRGCDAVVSCLGHVISLRGVFGPPRDLVTQATMRLCQAVEALQPAAPIKIILMSSVSVYQASPVDQRRGGGERAFLSLLRGLVPPARDNQQAADFLCHVVAASKPMIQWVAVRPDSLLDGEVGEYTVHEGLVSGLFKPAHTRMANVAHFMCELVTNPTTWSTWQGKLPVIVDAASVTG